MASWMGLNDRIDAPTKQAVIGRMRRQRRRIVWLRWTSIDALPVSAHPTDLRRGYWVLSPDVCVDELIIDYAATCFLSYTNLPSPLTMLRTNDSNISSVHSGAL